MCNKELKKEKKIWPNFYWKLKTRSAANSLSLLFIYNKEQKNVFFQGMNKLWYIHTVKFYVEL